VYSQYQPLKVFWTGALIMGLPAVALFIRFLVYYLNDPHTARGHIQSLIAGAVLFIGAMLLGSLGVIGDLLDAQRTLSQRTFERVRRIELQLGIQPSHYEPAAPARPHPAGDRISAASGSAGTSVAPPPHGPPAGSSDAPDREALEV
jgi:hypothetical protein